MKKVKDNSDSYLWGVNCTAWHMVNNAHLSVIEESMPPHTQEKRHYHEFAQQFFRITKGRAIFELNGERFDLETGEGVHVPAMSRHSIINEQDEDLEFILISQPPAHGDRIED